ncbi:MAG: hypothetical protein HOD54_01525 [Candidatus Magasanikbacteria bacterium]|nr:hypothetical protein [Candidatus Magasanikbacteria bacterium]MBT4314752.1 hypothetical protein [Candidatus Magasanikbacteria bacterium]
MHKLIKMHKNKKIHFIGICGVAMSALALAMKKAGHNVTGSDKGIYPPISTYLKESGVDYYTGWHPEKMGKPDLVVVGNVAGSTNPEWLHVQENNLEYVSYPELIEKFFIKENSIICSGTYGKTSSTALLTWILKQAKLDPTYMFGGISLNDIPAANLTNSKYNILEGDEYKSARWDLQAKFFHYHPTHLLLTSCQWDHADVYPTEESYFDAFQELINDMPKSGLIVASEKIKDSRLRIKDYMSYGPSDDSDYQYKNVIATKDGLEFSIINNSKTYNLKPKTLGSYMADNMTGAFAMAHELGIEPDVIIKALESFKNIKRRLEKKLDGDITVFDDIAHSPDKAKSVLETLRKIYNGKIFAVFEPNSGNRQEESISGYDNKFKQADEAIIPRLTHIKRDPNKPAPLDGEKLTEVISKTHSNANFINEDEKLINYLIENTTPGDVIVFLGSHGFRGMIDQLVSKLSM